jgi:WD40-like Beta Propeller Repeat
MGQRTQVRDVQSGSTRHDRWLRGLVLTPTSRQLGRWLALTLSVMAGVLVWAAPSQARLVHPYLKQLTGTPQEPFSSLVCGVTVDPGTGEVLVSDPGAVTKREEEEDPAIDVFSSNLAFVGQINKGVGAEWIFREACSTAVNDTTHNVYVANLGEGSGEERAEDERQAVFVYSPSGGGKYKFQKSLKLEGKNTPAKNFEANANGESEAGGPLNVAITQSSGDVWVSVTEQGVIDHFNAAGEYLGQIVLPTENTPQQLATDVNGDVFAVVHAIELGVQREVVDEFNVSGELVNQISGGPPGGFGSLSGVAVDAAGHIYVSDSKKLVVDEFDAAGAYMGQLTGAGSPAGSFAEPIGVSTDAAGDVYVADRTVERDGGAPSVVDIFAPAPVGEPPFIEGAGVSSVSSSSATLKASIDPTGVETSYRFEYGTPGAPFTKLAKQNLGAGESIEHVEVVVGGLVADTTYEYRVVVEAAGHEIEEGQLQSFKTQPEGLLPGLPDSRAWELVSPPNKYGALLKGIGGFGATQASADGTRITYSATAPIEANAPANAGVTPVLSVRGGQEWSSREIVPPDYPPTTSAATGSKGVEDMIFSPDLSEAIVDPFKDEPALSPDATEHTPYLRNLNDVSCNIAETSCYLPMVSGKEGFADVPSEIQFGGEKNGAGTLFGAVIPAGASPDLRHVALKANVPLKSGLEGKGLYEWNEEAPTSERIQLVSVLPGGTPALASEEPSLGTIFNSKTNVRNAVSSNGSRIVWSTGQPRHLFVRDTSMNETVQLDVPEEGSAVEFPEPPTPLYQTASSDDSVVFFTDAQRLTKTATSSRGKPDLYACRIGTNAEGKLACKLTDLTSSAAIKNAGEAAYVQGQIPGVSEDGSYLYFVADGVFTESANPRGEKAVPGACGNFPPVGATCNLYAEHYDATTETWEEPNLVAVLSMEDGPDWGAFATESSSSGRLGFGALQLRQVTSRVSPDGQYVAFMSDRRLTGFDNTDASTAAGGAADEEVFEYRLASSTPAEVLCASCNRFGVRPHGVYDGQKNQQGEGELVIDRQGIWHGRWLAANVPGWTEWNGETGVTAFNQSRYLLNNGRLFFNSSDALVPQDTNGTADVYEYEPDGVDCSSQIGCVGMLSSGESPDESSFLDASESGGDVFFLTTATLVTSDTDQSYDVYDAHDCNLSPCATSAVAPPPCNSSTSCQGAPPSGASLPTVVTGSVSASGNVQPAPTVLGTKVVKLTRAQELSKALKTCKKKKKKKLRLACEKTARKKYGAKKTTAKKAKGKKADKSHRTVTR